MNKQRVKIVQRKAKPQILHEFNDKGQHRLVLVGEEGNEVSSWFERHQTGEFKGFLFSAGSWPMQPGVFRQVMIESRTLRALDQILAGSVNLEAQAKAERPRPLHR